MLNQLIINNYAIVDHLDISLDKGMSALTGETGAGKSIILGALGLTLGDRADRQVIRTGAKQAHIGACFALEESPEALAWLQDHDFDQAGEPVCILRRIVARDGRSRAYINDQPTTLDNLKELGEMLIDIHSQHEHQSLLKTATHQRLLDAYGGLQKQSLALRQTAMRWRELQQELEVIKTRAEEDNSRLQLLSYQVKELDELALGENELAELDDEHRRLSNAEAALTANQQVLDLCSENESFNLQGALQQASRMLADMPYASRHNKAAAELLNTALIQVEEAVAELGLATGQFEPDPRRLEEVDQRLGAIHQVARKHRISPGEIAELHGSLRQELEAMDQAEGKIEHLEQELESLTGSYQEQAEWLSAQRRQSALALADEINAQLQVLGMKAANFKLALNTRKSAVPSGNGFEAVEFLVSTNPGEPHRPLIKIASGGELSRISLAIQVVAAQTSAIPTLVFDEVDVGIGGGVARRVGQLLRKLGDQGQVICVTHQPQVASQGHHHLYVSKSTEQQATVARISKLSDQDRVAEIARMLAGDAHSEQSLAHAREMLG